MNAPPIVRLQLRWLGRTLRVGLAVGFLLLDSTSAGSAPEAPRVAERSTAQGVIGTERRQVEATFGSAEAACQGRFLLTQCLDEARTTRRLALDGLQRRQLALDDAARRERSAQRLKAFQARARELGPAEPPTTAASSPVSPGIPGSPASRGLTVRRVDRPVERAPDAPDLPAAAGTTGTRAQPPAAAASTQVQRNQAAFLQRQQQAAAHRDAVLQRNARQDASKPPAAGLPVPAAAPASR
jgi:hypothetical protein